jgi:hypothetical protein
VFDFDLEKAKNLLLYNLEMRQNNTKVFEKRDIHSKAIQQAIEIYQIYVMPRNTSENHKVSIFRLGDSDPSKFSLFDILQMASASLDARFVILDDHELINGEVLIHDMKGYSLQHLVKCVANASILCKYMKYSQEAAPAKLIENHFINCSPVVTRIVNFFKTFLNADTVRSLKFHSSLETLYESVDRELLPNDLGGSAGDVADVFRVWKEKFMSKR